MSNRIYKVTVPKQAVGASLIYFDLWVPAAATLTFELLSVQPIVSGAVAVIGLLGVDLFLQRTSAIGTGGTAMTQEGTSQTAMTASCLNGFQSLDAFSLTGRLTPSGGATAGAVLGWTSVFTEESGPGTYGLVSDPVRNFYADIPAAVIPPNTGISMVQGSVASVGNIGFNVILRAKRT